MKKRQLMLLALPLSLTAMVSTPTVMAATINQTTAKDYSVVITQYGANSKDTVPNDTGEMNNNPDLPLIKGVTFRLQAIVPNGTQAIKANDPSTYIKGKNVYTGKTNSKGELIFEHLPKGTYLLTQVKNKEFTNQAIPAVIYLPTNVNGKEYDSIPVYPKNILRPKKTSNHKSNPKHKSSNRIPNSPKGKQNHNANNAPNQKNKTSNSWPTQGQSGRPQKIMQTGTEAKSPWLVLLILLAIPAILNKLFKRLKN